MSNARNISKAESRFVNASGDTLSGDIVFGNGVTVGSGGVTGGGKNDVLGDWALVYSNSSFPMSTSAQTIFAQNNSDGTTDSGLTTGVYLVKINVDVSPWYSTKHVGLMHWFSSETNGGNVKDIYLHGAGHAFNGATLYCRTAQNGRSANTDLRFQVWANTTGTVSMSVYVKRIG